MRVLHTSEDSVIIQLKNGRVLHIKETEMLMKVPRFAKVPMKQKFDYDDLIMVNAIMRVINNPSHKLSQELKDSIFLTLEKESFL